jgi:hypothetical protein
MTKQRQAYRTISTERYTEEAGHVQLVITFILLVFNIKHNRYDLQQKYYLEWIDSPGQFYSIHSPNSEVVSISSKLLAERELYLRFIQDNIGGKIKSEYVSQ